MIQYSTHLLSKAHHKKNFQCGNESLSKYLQQQASQDIKKKVASCFVIIDEEDVVKGYFTLSSGGIQRDLLPKDFVKKLPKYKDLPIIMLGRLAISKDCQGMGLGAFLLIDALKRSYLASKIIGAMAVVVDPIDSNAVKFYAKYGFIALPTSQKMLLPMKDIEDLDL